MAETATAGNRRQHAVTLSRQQSQSLVRRLHRIEPNPAAEQGEKLLGSGLVQTRANADCPSHACSVGLCCGQAIAAASAAESQSIPRRARSAIPGTIRVFER